MRISRKSRKCINTITSPFRAIHATLVSIIGEVLSLGVLSPQIKFLWKYIYSLLELSEIDEEYDYISDISE